MNTLNENELYEVNGGSISGTLINAITSAGKLIYNLGQSLGSSIRRIVGDSYCSI